MPVLVSAWNEKVPKTTAHANQSHVLIVCGSSHHAMEWRRRYENAKGKLLDDESLCLKNRELFREFFEYEEYKLKRLNRLSKLDEKSYKTVYCYITRLRAVNRWFDNRPWKDLTKEDIKRVYDALEDGEILTMAGQPFKDKDTYYHRILRGKPFRLAGKDTLVQEVMEFHVPARPAEPRFIREETFRRIIGVATKPEHRALLWLAWDIGENVGALLLLRRRDLVRELDQHTNEAEYSVNLRREILKRSRTPRMEATNYRETVEILDVVTQGKGQDELLFGIGIRMAGKVLERAARITGATCCPGGQKLRMKDLRSSMACDLLNKGWTTDEVNRRLGHAPGSPHIRKYANWLALDHRKPKKRLRQHEGDTLRRELDSMRERERLQRQRQKSLQEHVEELRKQMDASNRSLHAHAEILKRIRTQVLSETRRSDVCDSRCNPHGIGTASSSAKCRISDVRTAA